MRREVQIMHHLKGHENIVTLIGAFEDRASVHLVRPNTPAMCGLRQGRPAGCRYLHGGGGPKTRAGWRAAIYCLLQCA